MNEENRPGDNTEAASKSALRTKQSIARRADFIAFVEALYCDRTGRWFTPIGYGPYWTDDGRYDHEHFEGKLSHAWPNGQLVDIVDLLLAKSETADVYTCVSLTHKTRTKQSCAGCKVIFSDWDGDPAGADAVLEAVRELDGFAVASGTPGHIHCYIPLEDAVFSARATQLCEALQAFLPPGSDRGKKTVEVVLRHPAQSTTRPPPLRNS